MDEDEVTTIAFEDAMVRIHQDLDMEIPEWLQH